MLMELKYGLVETETTHKNTTPTATVKLILGLYSINFEQLFTDSIYVPNTFRGGWAPLKPFGRKTRFSVSKQ